MNASATAIDYQTVFDQVFPTFGDMEKYGRYGQLVFTLEAVFKAAGFDIAGQELASAQHNNICGSIGETDLFRIARSFIGWVNIDNHPDYRIQCVIDGFVAYNFYDLCGLPYITPFTLKQWDTQIKEYRLKSGIKGRKSQVYRDFVAEVAARAEIREKILDTARSLLETRARKIEKVRAEVKDGNATAIHHADHLRRTAYIIDAFCAVAGVGDDGKAEALRGQAEAIERGAAARRERVDTLDTWSADEVVSQSLAHPSAVAAKLNELPDVWAAMQTLGEAK